MSVIKRHKIDQLGIITSGLCALHCAALPLLLSMGMLGSLDAHAHGVLEISVIVVSALLGTWSIFNGLRGHGKMYPQLLIGFGALVIILGLLIPSIGHPLMAVGGFTLLYGHWLNWRLVASEKSE